VVLALPGLAYAWESPPCPFTTSKVTAGSFARDGCSGLPFLALLVSGGHTQLVDVSSIGRYRILGETLDDAAARPSTNRKMLGLPYPGGARLAALAEAGRSGRFVFPRPMLIGRPDVQFQWPEDRCPSSLAGPHHGRGDTRRCRARFRRL